MNETKTFSNRWRLHKIDTENLRSQIHSAVWDARPSAQMGEIREPTTFLSHEQIDELSEKLDEIEKIYSDLSAEYDRLFGQKKNTFLT